MWQNGPRKLWRRLATQVLLSSKAHTSVPCPATCCFPSPAEFHSSFSHPTTHTKTITTTGRSNHNNVMFSPPFLHYIPDRIESLQRHCDGRSLLPVVETAVLRDLKHHNRHSRQDFSTQSSDKPPKLQENDKTNLNTHSIHPIELKPTLSSQPPVFTKKQSSNKPSFLARFASRIKNVSSMNRNDLKKKVGSWKEDITTTLKHYGVASKLLWANVRVSSSLLVKTATGNTLTRRERQLLATTTTDMFRLVPFAVIIIVPFMELLLPVILKFFPNLLPSTFQDKVQLEQAHQRSLSARLQYANSLRDTVKEMANEIKKTRNEDTKRTAKDLDEFMNKVRTGAEVSKDDILGFAKFFDDGITLDNLSRPRLVSMCKYMGVKPYGTNAYLRYMLQHKLTCIKEDDILIQSEGGVASLSDTELESACRERGMVNALTKEEMRKHLNDWLELSLKFSMPSSLLILSRAFLVSPKVKPTEVVQAALSSLPDEVIDEAGVSARVSSKEASLEENKQKLELLRQERELIDMEKSKLQNGTQSKQNTNSKELDDKLKKE